MCVCVCVCVCVHTCGPIPTDDIRMKFYIWIDDTHHTDDVIGSLTLADGPKLHAFAYRGRSSVRITKTCHRLYSKIPDRSSVEWSVTICVCHRLYGKILDGNTMSSFSGPPNVCVCMRTCGLAKDVIIGFWCEEKDTSLWCPKFPFIGYLIDRGKQWISFKWAA